MLSCKESKDDLEKLDACTSIKHHMHKNNHSIMQQKTQSFKIVVFS